MHARTLAVLLVVVAALGGLAWWQSRREEAGTFDAERALLAGFDRARVVRMRVDNLERSLQLTIEAQPDGSFRLVDPVEYAVEPAVLENLMDLLANQRAIPVAEGDLKKLALDPPKAVIEIEERGDAGARTRRIALGEVDVDQQHLYALVDGELVRTERGLASALDRQLPDWRARRILSSSPTSVVELHRRGRYAPSDGGASIELALDAVLDGPWRATGPFAAQLDARAVNLLLQSLVWLQVDSFIDVPGDLEHYGLAEPEIEFELVDAAGRRELLRLSREPRHERWFASRGGMPNVFRISDDAVPALCVASSEFIERRVFAYAREDVQRVELAADGKRTTISRRGRGWRVSASDGERATLEDAAADGGAVDDLLTELERARFAALLFERKLEPSEAIGSLYVDLGDERQGGIFGAPFRTSDGAEGLPFRRDGDALVAALDPAILALVRTDPASLLSLELHKLAEIDVARIAISSAAGSRSYHKNAEGRWSRDASELEARDFAKLVDRLLSMRALAMLKRTESDVIDGKVDVLVTTNAGNELAYSLGRAPGEAGRATIGVYRDGSRYARVKPELHAELLELLGRD